MHIACVIEDPAICDRLVGILEDRPDTTIVRAGVDPVQVREALTSSIVRATLFCPLAVRQFLEFRKVVIDSAVGGRFPMMILLAEDLDSAFVYRALTFGVDDVVDISRDDAHVAVAIETAISGRGHAYDSYLVDEVDAQCDLTSLCIVYADGTDRDIVPMIAAGYTDREIADVLHYSHQVIRNRISRILLRSGIRNRTQLATRFLLDRLEGPTGD